MILLSLREAPQAIFLPQILLNPYKHWYNNLVIRNILEGGVKLEEQQKRTDSKRKHL
jgi:hypothetical protein